MELGGAPEGGPTLDPDVEAVRARQGQLATCAADGFYLLRLFVWMVHVLMSKFGAQGL